MITAIKIESQMNCEYICQTIHRAILQYQKNNPDLTDSMIIIDIKKPISDNDHIPKLEHNTNLT
jgi:hypothetical protein